MYDISLPFTLFIISLGVQIYRIGIKNKHQKHKILKIFFTTIFFEIVYPYEFWVHFYRKYRARKLPSDFLLFQ